MSRAAPGLYAITDRGLSGGPSGLVAAAEAAFAAGLGWLQLREKDLLPADLEPLARTLAALARRHGARLLVNDRADVALAAGADGVHLGERNLAVAAARAAFPSLLVGRSVHSVDGAARAAAEGADFVLLGPIFATPSKQGLGPPLGPDTLGDAVKAAAGAPVIAVGGIGPGEVAACLRAGAAGVAAIRGIFAAPDVGAAVRDYLDALADRP